MTQDLCFRSFFVVRLFKGATRSAIASLLVAATILISPTAPGGTIYVANNGNGTVGKYTTSGGTINAALVSGVAGPLGVAVSGSDLYVASLGGDGTVGKYTTSGGIVNPSLIKDLVQPAGLLVSGSDLLVSIAYESYIGEYTTSGALINPSFISNLPQIYAVAMSGGFIYVATGNGIIRKYTTAGALVPTFFINILDPIYGITVVGNFIYTVAGGGNIGKFTISGQTVNNAFIHTGLFQPSGIAESEGYLYVTNSFPYSTISVWNESTGALVNGNLVPGLNRPMGIVVTSDVVPLPAPVWSVLALAVPTLLLFTRFRTKKVP